MNPLQIIISAVDDASEQIAAISASLQTIQETASTVADDANADLESIGTTGAGDAITGIKNSVAGIGAGLAAAGGVANDIATPINNFTQSGISGAMQYQQQITALTNLLSNQASGTASTATQTQFLADKIANLKAENDKLAATHEKTTADEEKRNAQIAVNNNQIAMLTEQMKQQSSVSQMAGADVGALTSKFESAAQGAAQYGHTQQDAMGALIALQTQTHNVNDTMSDYQVVLDLAAKKGWTLTEAETAMQGAFTGRGMAITAATGVVVKDGLSSQAAFQAVGDTVKGSAMQSLQDYGTQTAALSASTSNLQTNSLMPLLGTLTDLTTRLDDVVIRITNWVDAHPQLTKEIMEFAVIFGGLLGALATFSTTVAPIVIMLGVFGVSIGVALGWIALIIAAIVALIAIGVFLVNNWGTISADFFKILGDLKDFAESIFTDIENWIGRAIKNVETTIHDTITAIWSDWQAIWQDIENFVGTIWSDIGNTVKTGVNDVISIINGMINAIDSIHINIPAITIPGTKIGTPAVDLGFNIPDIPKLATGGVVIGPTLAMIGESGPEAVLPLSSIGGIAGGSGSVINIYIQGGNYLDQNGATLIAASLAKKIQQNLKLTNFR